jgi:predicted Fe-Mo cluster-binding NifX family protein
MRIAIATHPESLEVERFGHEYPILLHEVEDMELKNTQLVPAQGGCCGSLAQRLASADVVICTAIGEGAANHLRELGVAVAVVPEGVPSATAIAAWITQTLEAGDFEASPCHGHSDGHGCGCHQAHEQAPHHEATGHHCGCDGKGKHHN